MKEQPQFLGKRQHARAIAFLPEFFFLFIGHRAEFRCRCESAPQQRRMQELGCQRSERHDVDSRHTHVLRRRARNSEHALERLNPLLAIRFSEMLDEEHPVDRIDAAEGHQLGQLLRWHRAIGPVDDLRSRRLTGGFLPIFQCLSQQKLRRGGRSALWPVSWPSRRADRRSPRASFDLRGDLRSDQRRCREIHAGRYRLAAPVPTSHSPRPQRNQTAIQFLLCIGHMLAFEQSLGHEVTQVKDIRSDLQQIRQQSPR